MSRLVVVALAAALLVGCAAPALGPVRPARPAPAPPAVAATWSEEVAITNLEAALARRGHGPEVLDGAMALVFDPGKIIVRYDGGEVETIAGGGAWLISTQAGTFWVFESGVILPADQLANR